jgi:hypothetical protein
MVSYVSIQDRKLMALPYAQKDNIVWLEQILVVQLVVTAWD